VNGVLFVISIGLFTWIMVENALHAIGPRPSRGRCASGDRRWAQWVPGAFFTTPVLFTILHRVNAWPWVISAVTLFEFGLFGMAVYKTVVSYTAKVKLNGRRSLSAILLHENIVYFFV